MLEQIEFKMKQQNIKYEDSAFTDWIYNEIAMMSPLRKIELADEILESEKFSIWYPGNFYTFDYELPEDPRHKYIPSYDEAPFIYLIKKENNILHGFNLNYLNPSNLMKIFLDNIFTFYYSYLDEREKTSNSRCLANYENILKYDRLFMSRAIYRKYDVKFMSNIKIVPKRYAKIYGMMGNGVFLLAPKSTVYGATLKNMVQKRRNNK